MHLKNGFFNSKGGYEFNVTLTAAAAALAIDGPGPISVDAVAGKARWGLFWGVFAVVGGIIASSFAIEAGRGAGADGELAGSDLDRLHQRFCARSIASAAFTRPRCDSACGVFPT